MRFIKLTEETGNVIYVDTDAIEAVLEYKDEDSLCRSRIDLISNCTYWVQESPEAIVSMIEQMEAAKNADKPDETLDVESLREVINLNDANYKNYRCLNCKERQLTSVHL